MNAGPPVVPDSGRSCGTQGTSFTQDNTLGSLAVQAYDIRMKISLDPSLVSEEAVEKMKEREEWAEKHRLESERRLSEFKAEVEKEQRARDLLKEKERRELELFDDILKTMYALAPEFSARREAALRVSLILAMTNDAAKQFLARCREKPNVNVKRPDNERISEHSHRSSDYKKRYKLAALLFAILPISYTARSSSAFHSDDEGSYGTTVLTGGSVGDSDLSNDKRSSISSTITALVLPLTNVI